MKYFFLACCAFLFFIHSSFSQENKTISEQWQQLIHNSNDWDGHKVVPKEALLQILKNTNDSLNFFKKNQKNLEKSIQNQKDSLLQIQKKNQQIQTDFLTLQKEKNTILLFGFPLNKNHYFYALWSIIFVLLLLCLGVFFLFVKAKVTTKNAVKIKNELDTEFKEYRASVIEKEKQLFEQLRTQSYKK